MGLQNLTQPARVTAPSHDVTRGTKGTQQSVFGKHIMLDMRSCAYERLNSLENCFYILNTLPDKIGMKKISAPHVFRYDAPHAIDSGITGLTIIAESHISLHTFPRKGYAFADIFSCKPFASDPVIDFFKQYLVFKECDIFAQNRGRGFSQNLNASEL